MSFSFRSMSKKTAIVIGAGAAALALTGTAAFAYWTTTGGGSGTANAASTNGSLVLTASGYEGISPGNSTIATITAANAGTTDLRVNTVHAVVSTSSPATCLAEWFTIADLDASGVNVPKNATAQLLGTQTLNFVQSATVNQDACKGATITLTLSTLPAV
jgi:hypothetical protein